MSDMIEPGSTFKVFIAAAALEHGRVRPEEVIDCGNGSIRVAGIEIDDWKEYGPLTYENVLANSSNVGSIRVGTRLSSREIFCAARNFGFGTPTGIDLPGEASGLLRPVKQWSRISPAMLSIGQELGVTPIQLACAVSAIANGGELLRPYVVERVKDASGRVLVRGDRTVIRRVLSRQTTDTLIRMMEEVVLSGTGTAAKIPGFRVAGKTGTAQKFDPEQKCYSSTRYVASFIGFVPADDPALAIAVVIDEPKGVIWGGAVAAPVFRWVAENSLRYLGIIPHYEPAPPEIPVITARRDASMAPAIAIPADLDDEVLPDLRGRSMREVAAILFRREIQPILTGEGVAVWQKPVPGSPIRRGESCRVRFAPGAGRPARTTAAISIRAP